MQISFGVIFSIIIIIAVIGVAFYVIVKFLDTSKCSEVNLFHRDFENYIEKAYSAEIHQDTFKSSLPSGIEQVCFGTPDPSYSDKDVYIALKNYKNSDKNVFLYPPKKACAPSIKLEHISVSGFFCIPVKDGKIQIKTEKQAPDSITIKPE